MVGDNSCEVVGEQAQILLGIHVPHGHLRNNTTERAPSITCGRKSVDCMAFACRPDWRSVDCQLGVARFAGFRAGIHSQAAPGNAVVGISECLQHLALALCHVESSADQLTMQLSQARAPRGVNRICRDHASCETVTW